MLVLDAVSKAYGAFRLGPLSLEVGEGVLAVLGPSGCGKTTLLSVVAGIVVPDAGSVRLNGEELSDRPPERRGTALVFQDGALFPHMTARENVAYAADSAERVERLAETLEIADLLDRDARTLSGGERQRVALARALASDPDALLLDEPLSNLDAPIKRRLRDDMRDLLTSLAIPVVYVTHDQREATGVGDRLAVMEAGRFHQVGDAAEVFERPATPFVASFTGNENTFEATVAGGDGDLRLRWGGHGLAVPESVAASLRSLAAGDRVRFCVRPEHVEVVAGAEADAESTADTAETDADGTATADRENVLRGRIVRRVFEGDAHRVTVIPEGTDDELQVAVSPPAFDRLGLGERGSVRVALPTGSIHLFGDSHGSDGSDG